jgi:hypothetical protein
VEADIPPALAGHVTRIRAGHVLDDDVTADPGAEPADPAGSDA